MVLRTAKPTREERAAMKHDELLRTVWLLDDVIESFRWIPVSERLPGRYEAVLVTAKMEIEEEPLVYEGVLGTGWELCGVKNSKDYIVSAWMPLPEPYSPY